MKPEELRIGNYVTIDQMLLNEIADESEKVINHTYFEMAMIDRMFCNVLINGEEEEFDIVDIKPIPLNEEWLIKFGHESSFISDLYEIGKLSFYIQDGICWIDVFGDSIEIKYVHRLQNLYFELTGEELTIK